MAQNLTKGAVMDLCFTSEQMQPVLQVFDLKPATWEEKIPIQRYFITLSDGLHYEKGILSMDKNDLISSGRLQKGSVIKLTKYIWTKLPTWRAIVILELDIIKDKFDLIGKPSPAPMAPPAQYLSPRIGEPSQAPIAPSPQIPMVQLENTSGNSHSSGTIPAQNATVQLEHTSENSQASGTTPAQSGTWPDCDPLERNHYVGGDYDIE